MCMYTLPMTLTMYPIRFHCKYASDAGVTVRRILACLRCGPLADVSPLWGLPSLSALSCSGSLPSCRDGLCFGASLSRDPWPVSRQWRSVQAQKAR